MPRRHRSRLLRVLISEYGASIWCDPYRWVPEAARLLRPGGDLVFLKTGLLRVLTTPDDAEAAGERLARSYFGLHRLEWSDDGSVEFDLPYGEWIRLFRATGFTVERLVELQASAGASAGRWTFVTPEWARRWPSGGGLARAQGARVSGLEARQEAGASDTVQSLSLLPARARGRRPSAPR